MKIRTDDLGPTQPIKNPSEWPGEDKIEKCYTNEELMQAIIRLENKFEAFSKMSETLSQILNAVRWVKRTMK